MAYSSAQQRIISLWNTAEKRKERGIRAGFTGFTPFVAPTRPPPGTYDPSIDAQVGAANRGYQDLSVDTGIQNTRAQDDFLLGQGELQKQLDRTLGDATTARGQQHSDYLLAQQNAAQDYGRQISDLQRSYDARAQAQTAGATAAGVQAGGALQQALNARMANQAHDRAPIDTNFQRFNQAADTGEQRQQSAFDLSTGRAKEDFASQLGQLGLGLSRGNEDRANTLARAGRETGQLGLDAKAQEWYQATQAGYDPGQKPKNEHTDPKTGQVYRLVRTSHGLRRLLPTGQLVRR